jgi:hypothetical protein
MYNIQNFDSYSMNMILLNWKEIGLKNNLYLFKDAFSITLYKGDGQQGLFDGELKRVQREAVVIHFETLSRPFPGTRESHENRNKYNLCFNPVVARQETQKTRVRLRLSILCDSCNY